jgi:hypothetical protein
MTFEVTKKHLGIVFLIKSVVFIVIIGKFNYYTDFVHHRAAGFSPVSNISCRI